MLQDGNKSLSQQSFYPIGDYSPRYRYTLRYYQGYVELHLEGKFSGYEYNTIWRELVEESYQHQELSWHRWGNRNQGRCRINISIQSADDIIKCFEKISKIFDPVLSPLSEENGDAKIIMHQMENQEILPPADSML